MAGTTSRRPRRLPRGSWFGATLLAGVLLLLCLACLPSTNSSIGRAGPPGHSFVGTASAAVVPLGASPPPTAYGAMAYDDATGSVILFGGMNLSGAPLATTWQYRNGNWTNLTPSLRGSPPARLGASFAYDAQDGALVLFGGCVTAACQPAFDDTWEFSAGAWMDLSPNLNLTPSARGFAPMTYDAADGYLLLFGGLPATGASNPDNDTWTFVGGHWHTIPGGVSSPAARYDEMLQYDPQSHTTVLFGGVGASAALGDTWTYRAGNWTPIGTAGGVSPSPRHGAGTCFDAADGYIFLLGGRAGGVSLGDVWAFNGTVWSPLTVAGNPPPGYGTQMAYDAADGYVLWFSGQADSNSLYTSTESYLHGTWSVLLTPEHTGPSVLSIVAPFFLILVVVVLAQGAGAVVEYSRVRREARDGFLLAPGMPVTWVGSGPKATPGSSAGTIFLGTMLIVFLPIIFLIGITAAGSGVVLGLLIIAAPLIAISLVVAYVSAKQRRIRSIGVAPPGVIVRRAGVELGLPWDYLHPSDSFYSPKAGWFNFRYATPKQPNRERVLPMTVEQARAVILSPYAPRWTLIPLASRLLGLPPSTPAPAPAMGAATMMPASPPGWPGAVPPPSPPPTTGVPGYGSPLPSGSPPSVSSSPPWPPAPPSPPVSYLPPPPPPPPPSYAYVPSPPPRPAPIARPVTVGPQVRCPRCGGQFPEFAYAFCPSCGTRVG